MTLPPPSDDWLTDRVPDPSAAVTARPKPPKHWRKLDGPARRELLWQLQARHEQRTPGTPGVDWLLWLLLAGRGFGKTRTGAEHFAAWGRRNPDARVAIVTEDFAAARDVCYEGESGMLAVLHPTEVRAYNRSLGELVLENGCRFKAYSSEDPEALRGPQHHAAWMEELAKWRYLQQTWDMLMFGLRLGDHPHGVITTTPKNLRLLRDLVARPNTYVTRGSTLANAENLSAAMLEELERRYGGTRLGRQELEGELLEDVEGALWSEGLIERKRVTQAEVPPLQRVVVAVDPAGSSGEDSDDTGIVVAGRSRGGCPVCKASESHAFILEDATCHLPPNGWAERALRKLDEWEGDRVVAERNFGADMVEATLRNVRANAPVRTVHASRGKRVRAEPVSALYEQGTVHHVGRHPALEEQMTTWDPEDLRAKSPDRVDALVWALTDVMIGHAAPRVKSSAGLIRSTRIGERL